MSEKAPLSPAEQVDIDNAKKAAERPSDEAKKFVEDLLRPARDNDAGRIDDMTDSLRLTAQKGEKFTLEYAQMKTALKKYIIDAYDRLQKLILAQDTPEGRKEWQARLNETQKDVGNYTGVISGFLGEYKQQNKLENKDLELKHLWELGRKGNEIYTQMTNDKVYGEVMAKATSDTMDEASFDFIYDKIQKRQMTGSITAEDSLKLLEHAGVTAILTSMDGSERAKFAQHLIEKDKQNAFPIIQSLVGSNYLSIQQGEQLVDLAISKNKLTADQKEMVMATMLSAQEKNAAWKEEVEKGLARPMFKNQIQRVLDPKFFGGLLLVIWRSVNLFATMVAYRKDPSELLTSPYVYLDIAGILGGSAMMGYPSVIDYLKKSSEGKKNQELYIKKHAALLETAGRYHRVSEKYIEKGGLVEAVHAIRIEHEKKNIDKVPTIAEIRAEAEKPYVKDRNPELARDLAGIETYEADQLNAIIQKIYETPGMEKTEHYNPGIDTWRQAQKLPPKSPPKASPSTP